MGANTRIKKYLDALTVYDDYRKSLRSMSGTVSELAMLRNIRKLDDITSVDNASLVATQARLIAKWQKYSSITENDAELANYYAKMETVTFPEPLTHELIQTITASPGFHFRNGQDLIEKASHQLTEAIKRIHTLDQLKRDESKIREALEQYSQLPRFQELAGDAIERCLATRPLQIQVGLEKNISGMLEHMGNYDTMNTQQHATGTKSFHAYLRNNETRVNGLCKGDVELFLDQHRNMGFAECWEKAGLQFRDQGHL